MTKQDYEALSQLIKVQRRDSNPATATDLSVGVNDALDNLARDMAQYMSRYPAFDEAKFLAAAGIT